MIVPCGRPFEGLHISEHMVNFHVRNAMAKLNAANKTDAVLRAAVMGLL
jgi:LuxR family transcriptional regulator